MGGSHTGGLDCRFLGPGGLRLQEIQLPEALMCNVCPDFTCPHLEGITS